MERRSGRTSSTSPTLPSTPLRNAIEALSREGRPAVRGESADVVGGRDAPIQSARPAAPDGTREVGLWCRHRADRCERSGARRAGSSSAKAAREGRRSPLGVCFVPTRADRARSTSCVVQLRGSSSSEDAQTGREELETLNEEFQATNEELEALNEELTAKRRGAPGHQRGARLPDRGAEPGGRDRGRSASAKRTSAAWGPCSRASAMPSWRSTTRGGRSLPMSSTTGCCSPAGPGHARGPLGVPFPAADWPQRRAARGERFQIDLVGDSDRGRRWSRPAPSPCGAGPDLGRRGHDPGFSERRCASVSSA